MKILLAEDDLNIANFLIRDFKYEKCVVDHVSDGKEAIKKILDHAYDVVVLDLILPSMSGEEIVKKARLKGISTPIIVLTAVMDVQTRIRLLNAGVDDFLVKPFSFEELYARLLAILRRTENEPSFLPLKIADLELLPQKRIACRAKKEIPLRRKEYELLEYMLRHPNRVLSRDELMQKVWGNNVKLRSNTVDSHMYSLRRKIDAGKGEPLIKTVHGGGYMLAAIA